MATEIGLDLKLFSTRTICGLMKEATEVGAGNGALARLEDSVRSLEEEKRKIEAFKRELPLCMHLLTDVIEGLKKEMEQRRGERFRLGFEEFMPKKGKFEDAAATVTAEPDCKDKMNWMSSFQLWSNSSNATKEDDDKNHKRTAEERIGREEPRPEKETLLLDSKSRHSGAFVPFKGPSANSKEEKPTLSLPDLSLMSSPIKSAPHPVSAITEDRPVSGAAPKGVGRAPMSSSAVINAHLSLQAQQQAQRKARRCWSPELHRRFVLALQHLGGAQVATPKQIRELMKVDGLTNDEVKSHLQKYRLHSRRAPNASSNANQTVMVEGLWSSPENFSSSSQQSISQSGSPQSPLQLVCSNQTLSITAGDSCEEEDGRSESYSWK